MTQPTPTRTYVAMVGEFPQAATTDLDTAKIYCSTEDSRYSPGRRYRWDKDEHRDTWQLMVWNVRTRRWGKTYRSVVQVPNLPAA